VQDVHLLRFQLHLSHFIEKFTVFRKLNTPSRFVCTASLATMLIFISAANPARADQAANLANKRIVFLGDSITQAGRYISFTHYYLETQQPELQFDVIGLGLSSETVSGLSEDNHAGGKFPRPCLFERLARLLDKAQPDVVFACYGMNDGIYLPLSDERFQAFKQGINELIDRCQDAGVKQIYLITPPIFDTTDKPGEFNYDNVLTAYADWETQLKRPGVQVIDLHTRMTAARTKQTVPFSKDRVHPGEQGHLLMAKTIVETLGMDLPEKSLEQIKDEPLFQQVDRLRKYRAQRWMQHIGYTREKTIEPQPLGDTEREVAKMRQGVDMAKRVE